MEEIVIFSKFLREKYGVLHLATKLQVCGRQRMLILVCTGQSISGRQKRSPNIIQGLEEVLPGILVA